MSCFLDHSRMMRCTMFTDRWSRRVKISLESQWFNTVIGPTITERYDIFCSRSKLLSIISICDSSESKKLEKNQHELMLLLFSRIFFRQFNIR